MRDLIELVEIFVSYNVFINKNFKKINESAQPNLGREPRRGAVAHVRRKIPIG